MELVYDSQFLTILEDLRSTVLLRRESFTFFWDTGLCVHSVSVSSLRF